MKVAIITSGLLPIPAVKGGAIETLLDSFIIENEKSKKLDLDIYSIDDRKIDKKIKKDKTNYIYINNLSNFIIRVINKIFKKNIPINKYYQKKVIRKINQKNYDFVIVENYPELVLSLKKFKVIPYIHSDVFNKDIYNANEILENCYKVITVSNFINMRVVEINKKYKNKVITVYNSIDFDTINDDDYIKYRNYYRNKYNIDKNDYVYAFSGRISKEKGVLELIKAFNKINVPNKKLLVIGGIWYGSKKKNDYLIELEQISNDKVIYTGYVEHNMINKILCATDVGVVPSICNEAAGLSVVEFMNLKNIVVASNMGGIKEYLNIKSNYLVECNENFVENLKESLEKCYQCLDIKKRQDENYKYSLNFIAKKNYQDIINVLGSR